MREELLTLLGVGCIWGVVVLEGEEADMIRGVLQQHPPDGKTNDDFGLRQVVAWMIPSSGDRDGSLGGG